MDFYYGQIILLAFDYAPVNCMIANGSTLEISEYQALYALLGTTYGGDGRNNFEIPDLRGRSPICYGTGTDSKGNSYGFPIGESLGEYTATLTSDNLPSHTHEATVQQPEYTVSTTVATSEKTGVTDDPSGNITAKAFDKKNKTADYDFVEPADAGTLGELGGVSSTIDATKDVAVEIGNTGANQSFSKVQPILAMNYVIAVTGIWPTRADDPKP